jgi:hypothetical protein
MHIVSTGVPRKHQRVLRVRLNNFNNLGTVSRCLIKFTNETRDTLCRYHSIDLLVHMYYFIFIDPRLQCMLSHLATL